MQHVQSLSMVCLRAWLEYDSMVSFAWMQNSYLTDPDSVGPRQWHDLLLREKRDPMRFIVTFMLRQHAERIPPVIILTEAEARAYFARADPQDGSGERAPAGIPDC